MSRKLTMPAVTPARHPKVTDHAVLRWMERHLLIDVEAVRASILTPERIDAIRCGAVHIHCREEGVTLVVSESGAITTALPIHARRGDR